MSEIVIHQCMIIGVNITSKALLDFHKLVWQCEYDHELFKFKIMICGVMNAITTLNDGNQL